MRLRQPLTGHRVGHDTILLAAATNGRAGEYAVDLGAGVGAAGLALAARVAGLKVTLAEIDPTLSALAASNARLNHMDDRVDVITVDVEEMQALAAAGLAPGSVDRVLMNSPFHDAARQICRPTRAGASLMRRRPVCCSAGSRVPRGCSSRKACWP